MCDKHGIVMIADEVQTGFARTGALFAMEQMHGVAADLTTMAKGLAGGLPLAAVTGRAESDGCGQSGRAGWHLCRQPLGIAAANAVLDVIEEEDLCARANELGSRLKQRLEASAPPAPEIIDIRGPGFMVAVEFANPSTQEPDAGFTGRVRLEAQKRGLILLTCGVYGNVVRFLAPITIPDAHFAEAMDILEASVAPPARADVAYLSDTAGGPGRYDVIGGGAAPGR